MSQQPESIDVARYERAAGFVPAHFLPPLSGGMISGYWLDHRRYFFCVREASEGGGTMNRPYVVDAETGAVTDVVATDMLVSILAGHSGKEIDPAALAHAQYDMPDAARLIVTIGLDAYHVDLSGPGLARVETLDPMPALHSPDGRHAAFLKDHTVWLKDRASGTARQLMPDGELYHAYGASPESGVAPVSGRRHPMPNGLWSADSQWFVTHRVDERAMPFAGLVEHVPTGGARAIAHVYKVAGPDTDLPTMHYVAVHIPTGRTVVSDRASLVHVFSPFGSRHCWFDGETFYVIDRDRFAAEASLVAMDLETGKTRVVMRETADMGWIDVHPSIGAQPIARPLPASNELIWWSERDGFGHLYLIDMASGSVKNRITQGNWMVRDIVHVDPAARRILFLASGFDVDSDRGHRRLCAVDFDGTGFEILLAGPDDIGIHPDPMSGVDQLKPFRPSHARSGVSSDGRYVVAQFGAVAVPTRTALIAIETGGQTKLTGIDDAALRAIPEPQAFEVLAADGVTKLYGSLYFPTDFDPDRSYPLVDYIYPGPQVNWYARRFPNANALVLQSVIELGMVGLIMESRGMPNRDRAFHQSGNGGLLEPQLSDHVAAIEQLCQRHGFIDRDRVGLFGMSGGGYATARALFDYPDMFKVGVSICGNHENRNYIGHWIDKYGGRPGTPERDDQSNVAAAHKLQGKLCLIHGDMDDNVHPAHTLAVVGSLIEAGKDFDLLIVPGAGHGVLFESSYAMQRLWNFFGRHLIGQEPPEGFTLRWTPAETAQALGSMAENI